MKVIELKYKDEFGKINKVKELYLSENKGIENDINSKNKKREISILFLKKKEDIKKKDYNGLCTKKFYENIIIEGQIPFVLSKGQKIIINDSIIEITMVGKRCFGECILIKEDKKCILTHNVVFGKVIKSDNIKINNFVKILSVK